MQTKDRERTTTTSSVPGAQDQPPARERPNIRVERFEGYLPRSVWLALISAFSASATALIYALVT